MMDINKLKRAQAQGKNYCVVAQYGGIINSTMREVGEVISCHNNHSLAERSPAGRSQFTRIGCIHELLDIFEAH